MVVHSLQCTECDATRVGRDTTDGIAPVRKACPKCGSTEYVPLAATRDE